MPQRAKLTIRNAQDGGRSRIDAIGTQLWETEIEVKEILDYDPTSAKIDAQYSATYKRGAWDCRVESYLRVSLTKDNSVLVGQIKAFDHDAEVVAKT